MKKALISGVMLCIIMVVISGCVASNTMKDLKKDKPVSSDHSVAFWKIRITDKTGTVATPGKVIVPSMYIQKLDVDNYGSTHIVYPQVEPSLSRDGRSEKTLTKYVDVYRYEQMMAVSLDPGRYHVKTLFLQVDGQARFPIDINRLFRAMPGRLYYIGSLNIMIYSNTNGELSYSMNIDYDTTRQDDVTTFVSRFPDLSNGFGNKQVTNRLSAYYKYNFSYDIESFPAFIRTDDVLAEINIDGKGRSYIIQRFSENEDYSFITNRRIHAVSSNDSFIVEWDSKWVDGVKHLSYGLFLGSNPQNAYFFSASGDGKSAVFHKKDDRWQSEPCHWKNNSPTENRTLDGDHYKVEFSKDRVIYSVNNQQIAEFKNTLQFNALTIGLFVSGKESIIFDNIIIEQTSSFETTNN